MTSFAKIQLVTNKKTFEMNKQVLNLIRLNSKEEEGAADMDYKKKQ